MNAGTPIAGTGMSNPGGYNPNTGMYDGTGTGTGTN
jgi:hypothetical protein